MEVKTTISVRESDKAIYLMDRTDPFNEPRGYNKNVRGFKKVANYINSNMEKLEQMSMYQVIAELDKVADLRFRTYCAMD